jgi:hypothetical protein
MRDHPDGPSGDLSMIRIATAGYQHESNTFSSIPASLDLWRRSLKRRSQKDRMTWARMDRLAAEWLPPPHVLHPWPEERMAVRYPR